MTMKSKAKEAAAKTDAITLLTDDHKKVKKLFKDFEKSKDNNENKAMIVRDIIDELTMHAQLEEEYLYPAAREALNEPDLIDEATVEHATVKELISQLENMDPSDELYDAKVTVLGEYVEHHVEEEENEIFPQLKKAKIDIETMGEHMHSFKEELQAESGMDETSTTDERKTTSKSNYRRARKSSSNARPART